MVEVFLEGDHYKWRAMRACGIAERYCIIRQLNALFNVGLLSRFVGMTTDSQSFMSFIRHAYFRRTRWDLIAKKSSVANYRTIRGTIEDVCGGNAWHRFGLSSDSVPRKQSAKNNVVRSV